MSLNLLRNLGCISVVSLSLVAGCGAPDDNSPVEEAAVSDAAADEKADSLSIAFTAFDDDIGSVGQTETRKLFTTSGSYKAYFGHDAPRDVDFSKEWVVFYSAGVKRTGGFEASVARVALAGRTLNVTTSLVSPGPDCFVTQALTKPHALVKLAKPRPAPSFVRYYRSDSTNSCAAPTCDAVRCAAGTHCELVQVTCIKAPCYPQPQCVADPTCPGRGRYDATTNACVCPPNNTFCIAGTHWNGDPSVCACTSLCDSVRCAAGTHCEAVGNAVSCVADPVCPGRGVYNATTKACDCPVNTTFCINGTHWNGDASVCSCVPDGGNCNTVADCVKVDNYCGGCACEAHGKFETPPTCANPVACFAEPCAVDSRTLACINNKCTLR